MKDGVTLVSRSTGRGFTFFIILFFICVSLPASVEPEVFSYISCATFEYSGQNNFRFQNAGVVDVSRQRLPDGDYGYSISSNTDMMAGENQANAEIASPPLLLMRDAGNRTITGGFDCLKEIGEIGNRALSLSQAKVITDNKWRHYDLPMNPTVFYPANPGFTVKYEAVNSRKFGHCLLITAVSDFFVCSVPGEKQPLTGIYKVVMLSDPSLRNMYYRCSGYEARMGTEQVNIKDNFWLSDPETGEPADITDIRPQIDREVSSIFMPDKGVLRSDCTAPGWALHAVAVKRFMDVSCGAVIEGQPNFAILVAVAGVLLVDSVVSTASELLAIGVKKATGKDIPVYQGIPNFVGSKIGEGGAMVYEKVTGNKADKETWKSVGGDLADIAAIFLSPAKAAKGLKMVGKGLKFGVKAIDARKYDMAIRIGKYALSLETAQKIGKLFDIKTGVQKIKKLTDWMWGPSGGSGPGGVPGGGPGVPGGVMFEGDVVGLKLKDVKYQAADNSFVINGNVKYASPLPAEDMAAVLRQVETEGGLGLSLAGMMRGGINKENRLYHLLSICDIYLGNVIFGRLDQLPAGCVADPEYKASLPPENNPGAVCAVFNFRCKLNLDRDVLKRRNVILEVSLVPYSREKAEKDGVYEYAEPKEKDMKALGAYEKNVGKFRPEFYLKQPVIVKTIAVGEAAVFAMWMRAQGVELGKLAEEIAQVPPKTGAYLPHNSSDAMPVPALVWLPAGI